MANFAVAAPEEVIKKGNDILDRMARPQEKKGETLNRVFDVVLTSLDDEVIQKGGGNSDALESAIKTIRDQFVAVLSGNAQILAEKDAQIIEIREARKQLEAELKKQVEEAGSARKQAEAAASIAQEELQKTKKDLEKADDLLRCIDGIQASMNETKAKLKENDALQKEMDARYSALQEEMKTRCSALQKEKDDALEQVRVLEQKLRDQELAFRQQTELLKKDQEAEIRQMQTKMEHMVSDTQKDADLAREKALAQKEREMQEAAAQKLRMIERENVRLEMENESFKGMGTGRRAGRRTPPSGRVVGAENKLTIEGELPGAVPEAVEELQV